MAIQMITISKRMAFHCKTWGVKIVSRYKQTTLEHLGNVKKFLIIYQGGSQGLGVGGCQSMGTRDGI